MAQIAGRLDPISYAREWFAGRYYRVAWEILDLNGAPVDVTGHEYSFGLYPLGAGKGTPPLFPLRDMSNGMSILNGPAGLVLGEIASDLTDGIGTGPDFYYWLDRTDGAGGPENAAHGPVYLRPAP